MLNADAPLPPADSAPLIIVTGERVTRSVKETPSSVAVFGKREIDRLAAPDRVPQLLQFVPNVLVGSSRDTPTIRGQDSIGVLQGLPGFLGGARPRTTLQIDGRAAGYNEFAFGIFGLWDVDRVEVFRTPQTTTQGPNAIGGAIFIQTADPTYAVEARLRAIAGQAHTREISGTVSSPLIADQLAFRVSGDLRQSHTASRLGGPVRAINLNHDDYGTVRAKLLAEPAAIPGLRLLLTYAHNQSQAPQAEIVVRPVRQRRDPTYIFGDFRINVDSLTAALRYQLADGLQSRTTLSFGDAHIRRFAPRGFGETRIHGRDRSLESVMEWQPDARIGIVGGVHLLTTNLAQKIDLRAALLGSGRFKDRQESRGVFGDVSWHPAARWSLTAGLRYQTDSKTRSGSLAGGRSPLALDFDKSWHALLPKVSVAYDVRPNLRVGALVLRAYNPGGVSLDLTTRAALPFDPEYLWDYEVFARGTLLDGALSFAANLFTNDMTNAQRQLRVVLDSPAGAVGLSAIANAPAARSYGAEVEWRYRVSQRLTLQGAAGVLGTRLTRTVVATDPLRGKQFARAPSFTGAAGIEWMPLRALTLSSQVRHNSSYFGNDANDAAYRVCGSTTADANVSWRARRVTMFAYARNLFDDFHVISWNGLPSDPHASAVANDPREIGLGIEAAF